MPDEKVSLKASPKMYCLGEKKSNTFTFLFFFFQKILKCFHMTLMTIYDYLNFHKALRELLFK